MKKGILAILICTFSIFCMIALSSCIGSCTEGLLKPKEPTEESIRKDARKWDIELPENFKILNYWINLGLNDGICYYELEYYGDDENFNSLLTYEKNEDIENLSNLKFENKDAVNVRCTPDCAAPQITDNYGWLILYDKPYEVSDTEIRYFKSFYLAYLIDTNRLIIYDVDI